MFIEYIRTSGPGLQAAILIIKPKGKMLILDDWRNVAKLLKYPAFLKRYRVTY